MRLRCKIGWHAAQDRGRWNRHLCFSRCRHCGRDLIRTRSSRWHEPAGYRVVWSAPEAASQCPEPDPAATPVISAPGPAMSQRESWEMRMETAARRRIASLNRADFMGDMIASLPRACADTTAPAIEVPPRKIAG